MNVRLILLLLFPAVAFAIQHLLDHSDVDHVLGFGKYNAQVDWYNITPLEDRGGDEKYISLPLQGKFYHFQFTNETDIFAKEFYEANKNSLPNVLSCVYTGRQVENANVRIALTGCGNKKRGMIVTEDGSHVLIQPVPPRSLLKLKSAGVTRDYETSTVHILHKRSTVRASYPPATNTPFRQVVRREEPITRRRLTIEIGLFVDQELWNRFVKIYGPSLADAELLQFVIATINNVNALFNHPSLVPKLNLQIKKYHVFKRNPPELESHVHAEGEATLLLSAFCNYQRQVNPGLDSDPHHWDHAVLFTGHDIHTGPIKAVAGFAPVGGMCNPLKSCTINEGADFGCVFVIAHEIGHSLGMTHDGDNGCNAKCCIMSPFVGDGKTSWSQCSVNEMNKFLKLGKNCLFDNYGDQFLVEKKWPGQMYTLDQQCRMVHGEAWKHLLQSSQSIEDVCRMIWCSAGEGVIRNAHPALEGTYCGHNKWCLEGKCQMWNKGQPPKVIHGHWGQWSSYRRVECKPKNHRLATFRPNNGGQPCVGSEYRAYKCDQIACAGLDVNDYATQLCSQWQINFPKILSGVGLQHNKQSCNVWCHVKSSAYAHSVGNFPDGTLCDREGGYCVRGNCLKFLCANKNVLVQSKLDCPDNGETRHKLFGSPKTKGKKTNPPLRKVLNWTPWTVWGMCSSTHWRTRYRRCRIGQNCTVQYERQRIKC